MSRCLIMDLPGPMRIVVTPAIAGMELNRVLVMVLEPNGENFTPLGFQWFPNMEDAIADSSTLAGIWLADEPINKQWHWIEMDIE